MFILQVIVEDEDSGFNGQFIYVFDIFVEEFWINVFFGVIYMVKKIEVGVWEFLFIVVVLVIDYGIFIQCVFVIVQIRIN